jgi:hypothetical protein
MPTIKRKLYAPVVDFYVRPSLDETDPMCEEPKPITTYVQLFPKGETCLGVQYINVTGPWGIGKSTLCKRICATWCQAHDPDESLVDRYRPEDIAAMMNFQFLFLINEKTDGHTFSEWVANCLPYSYGCFHFKQFTDIWRWHSCLFLLDDVGKSFYPMSYIMDEPVHCTVLATSCEPTIGISNTSPSRQIVMNKLDNRSSIELVTKTTQLLADVYAIKNTDLSVDNFDIYLSSCYSDRQNLTAHQIIVGVCSWIDGYVKEGRYETFSRKRMCSGYSPSLTGFR